MSNIIYHKKKMKGGQSGLKEGVGEKGPINTVPKNVFSEIYSPKAKFVELYVRFKGTPGMMAKILNIIVAKDCCLVWLFQY